MPRFQFRALLFFSGLAVAHTWPIARYARTRVVDLGDGLLNVWLLAASARQLVAHPLAPFDVNMYSPFRHALATLDHQWTAALVTAPLTVTTNEVLLAANLFTIATFALAGLFTAVLVRRLTGSDTAGLVAGCVYAFSPMRIENLNHSHVLGNCWLPLALLAWHDFVTRPTWRNVWLVTAASVWLALGSWFLAVVGGLGVAVVAMGEWAQAGPQRWVALRRSVVPVAATAGVLGLIALPYVAVSREYAAERPSALVVNKTSSDVELDRTVDEHSLRVLSIPVESYLGVADGTHAPWLAPLKSMSEAVGARYFPGIVASMLAAIGAWVVARSRVQRFPLSWLAIVGAGLLAIALVSAAFNLRSGPVWLVRSIPGFFFLLLMSLLLWLWPVRGETESDRWMAAGRIYLVLGAVGVLLSLGDQVRAFGSLLGRGVYPMTIPPFNLLRASSRFGALFSMSAAVLAGWGYAMVTRRVRRPAARHAIAASVLLLVNAELFAAPVRLTHVGAPPDVYEWLAKAPRGPVVDFPIHGDLLALHWSLYHRHPLINGGGAIQPEAYHRLERHDDLSPEMLAHLRTYWHPRYIVVNTGAYKEDRARVLADNLAADKDQLTLVAQFGARQVFEVTGPSSGAVVMRSYPAGTLSGKRDIVTRGRVEQVTPRGTPVLQLWGDGRLVGSSPPVPLAREVTLQVPLPPNAAHGLNLEVMADYTLAPSERTQIGRTGGQSPVDVAVTVSPERSRIQVNGHVWAGEKGYTVVTLNPDGRLAGVRAFNTSWSEDESHALAAYLHSITAGSIVAVASFFDASRSLTDDAVRELAALGLTGDLRGKFQWAHAGIGIKGAPAGTAVESIGEKNAECRVGSPSPVTVAVDEVRID